MPWTRGWDVLCSFPPQTSQTAEFSFPLEFHTHLKEVFLPVYFILELLLVYLQLLPGIRGSQTCGS